MKTVREGETEFGRGRVDGRGVEVGGKGFLVHFIRGSLVVRRATWRHEGVFVFTALPLPLLFTLHSKLRALPLPLLFTLHGKLRALPSPLLLPSPLRRVHFGIGVIITEFFYKD